MKDDFTLLKQLLEKYRVTRPLPEGIQDHLIATRRQSLVKILKKLGRYNPVFGAIIFIFFLFKKFGISFSVVQSALILAAVSAVAAVSISTGVYMGVTYFVNQEVEKPVLTTDIPSPAPEPKKPTKPIAVKPPQKKQFTNTIVLNPFRSSNLDRNTSNRIMRNIKNELTRLRGKNNLVKDLGAGPGIFVFGSAEKIKNTYRISARGVGKDGNILFKFVEESQTPEGVNQASRKIAGTISRRVK
ncbi:MAG: hypothetical protein GY754_15195 [bacterium]|nr:hypothetical protein [bacterium]